MSHFKGRLLDKNEDKMRKQRVKLHKISMSVPGGEAWEREKRLLEGWLNSPCPPMFLLHVQLPQKDNRLY